MTKAMSRVGAVMFGAGAGAAVRVAMLFEVLGRVGGFVVAGMMMVGSRRSGDSGGGSGSGGSGGHINDFLGKDKASSVDGCKHGLCPSALKNSRDIGWICKHSHDLSRDHFVHSCCHNHSKPNKDIARWSNDIKVAAAASSGGKHWHYLDIDLACVQPR